MRYVFFISLWLLCVTGKLLSQTDSAENEQIRKYITLSEVVIRNNLNIPDFISRVKNDTTFYKAFKNLRIIGFSSLNDIRIINKKGKTQASLYSKTRQQVSAGCRTMQVLEERHTGDFYDRSGDYNYYTASLYASLFFTKGRICGENNIVRNSTRNPRSESGMEKHKEQLKMLFFDPGKKIPGIPLMGEKTNIFSPQLRNLYDMSIDMEEFDGKRCYVFKIMAKPGLSSGQRDKLVFDNMVTWFEQSNYDIVGRSYDLSYNAGVYDFDVHIEVLLTHFGPYLVPKTLRYNGNWDVAFKKRERAIFTATLFGFNR